MSSSGGRRVCAGGSPLVRGDVASRDPYPDGVYLFLDVELWINRVLVFVMLVLQVWALVDCATRSAQAFPTVNKLTKPVWLAITIGAFAVSGLIVSLYRPWFSAGLNPISLIAVVAALVYLADVRPAVREVSGGSGQRW